MDNFTPLKTKNPPAGGKKANKLLIVGNVFLVTVLIFMTSFFLKDRSISTQQKAAAPLPTRIPITTRAPTPIPSKTPTPTATVTPKPTEMIISLSPTAAPTEIIIAKISTSSPTAVVSLPKTGTIKSFIYIVPALIMLVGLIL
mgnify:CR=1 FL=1